MDELQIRRAIHEAIEQERENFPLFGGLHIHITPSGDSGYSLTRIVDVLEDARLLIAARHVHDKLDNQGAD